MPGKSGAAIPRRDVELLFWSEATDAMLPGKTSKLQVTQNRTLNGHTWAG